MPVAPVLPVPPVVAVVPVVPVLPPWSSLVPSSCCRCRCRAGWRRVALVIVLVSSVTAPLRASALPCSVAPVVIEIDVRARMLPTNWLPVPIVAELPTCQKTLQACAPPISVDDAAGADGQGRAGLEDEDGVRVALGVEGQGAAQPERARGGVDPGRQRATGEVGGDRRRRASPGGVVVGGGEVALAPAAATPSVMWIVPAMTIPGGKPVTADPGSRPTLPLMTLGPVLVTVLPARTAKVPSVPSPTVACAPKATGATTSIAAASRAAAAARRRDGATADAASASRRRVDLMSHELSLLRRGTAAIDLAGGGGPVSASSALGLTSAGSDRPACHRPRRAKP